MKIFPFFISAICFFSAPLLAQEDTESSKKSVLTMSIGHAHIGQGVQNGNRKTLVLPAWGLTYDRLINEKWKIGLHTDIIVEEFEVEIKENDVDITVSRSRPFSSALTVSHELTDFLAASIGIGREFAPEEDFNLIRIGIEPYVELPNNFEVVGTFSVDFRFEAYNAFNLALGIAKRF